MSLSDSEFITALQTHGSNAKLAAALGIHIRNVQRRRKTLGLKGWSPEHDLHHPVADGQQLKGASTLYKNGEVVLQWVKSKADPDRIRAMIDELCESAVKDLPRLRSKPVVRGAQYATGQMTCYPIGDAHIGMAAWAEECGEDWDLEIARTVQCQAMDDLVQRMPRTEKATIINLGDWHHADNMEGVTSRSGNSLDMAGRYAKMVDVGIVVMRQCIESALGKHKTVHVINQIGNHDDTGAIWLARVIAHMYAGDKRVTVETSPSVFNYFSFGSTLVGIHHGHTTKAVNLPGVMATDRPLEWGHAKHRYWWCGHVHHQKVQEFPGVIVESFNTLAAKDAYAAEHGYRAQRNMKGIVLDAELGEIERHTVIPRITK